MKIFDCIIFNNENLTNLNLYENIVLENLGENINEKLIYNFKNLFISRDENNYYLNK